MSLRPRFLPACLVLALSTVLPASAWAGCEVSNFSFDLTGASKTSIVKVDSGDSCSVFFRAGGQYSFSSLTLTEKPSHGTVAKDGRFSFSYEPKAGFRGKDMFALELCGAHGIRGKGCVTLRYDVTVR